MLLLIYRRPSPDFCFPTITYGFVLCSYGVASFLVDFYCWPSPNICFVYDLYCLPLVLVCYWLIKIVGPCTIFGFLMVSFWCCYCVHMFLLYVQFWLKPSSHFASSHFARRRYTPAVGSNQQSCVLRSATVTSRQQRRAAWSGSQKEAVRIHQKDSAQGPRKSRQVGPKS